MINITEAKVHVRIKVKYFIFDKDTITFKELDLPEEKDEHY